MALHTLHIQNLRIIEHLELSLARDATLFYGENGAGKTSILEAIDFLSRGRTFRSRNLGPILRNESKEIIVSGKVIEGERTTTLGIQKSADEIKLHCDQQKIQSIATHASYLPVITIHPDSHMLIQGGARNRRNYLDWSAFHVKPEFLKEWRKFNKCLRQRNHILRSSKEKLHELPAWTKEFGNISKIIDQTRSRIFNEISGIFEEFISKLLPECKLELMYQKGWPKQQTLEEALEAARVNELKYKTTRWGPQRADIKITLGQHNVNQAASRGQQKLIAASLLLAQIKHLQQHSARNCVVLLDDIRAELDNNHAHALFAALQSLKCQVFLSAIEPDDVNLSGWENAKMFHVKQGKCELSS